MVQNIEKIAFIHDWYSKRYYGGAEKTAEILNNLITKGFNSPDLFALFEDLSKKKNSWIYNKKVTTSFIQNLPFSDRFLQYYFPLFPLAIEQLDLDEYDLIISSSHLAAKGVLTSPDQLHISYIHTPMRYAWDQMNLYLQRSKLSKIGLSPLIRLILHFMRYWDQLSSTRIDYIASNSNFTASRIKKYWGRDSKVIFPPVMTSNYVFTKNRDNFYLSVCRLVPNKRVDILIKAFNKLKLPLFIIGDGPEKNNLLKLANKNVKVLGFLDDQTVKNLMETCRAFVYAGTEDFGIAPVEAMAAGAPVIGYDYAGLKDTINCVTSNNKTPTGLLFKKQNVQSLYDAVTWFEDKKIWKTLRSDIINEWSFNFSQQKFELNFRSFINECLDKHNSK